MASHKPSRDVVAALEKALSDELRAVGYDVLNVVKSRKQLNDELLSQVITAFAEHVPKLNRNPQ